MTNVFHNHRDFEKKNFIYKDVEPKHEAEKTISEKTNKSLELFFKKSDLEKMRKMNKKDRFEYIKKQLDEKYDPVK